jgi:predicted metal-dependent phosphoesterase TrpH
VRDNSGERWLKAELHSHCSLDPFDYRICSHSPEQLIYEASRQGYDVLSITCHDLDVWSEELSEYAESLGVTLIPGMEVNTEGRRHTLVYNFRTGAANLDTLAKIRARKSQDTLVIAPHPYFPGRVCLRGVLDDNLHVFDAVELSGFFAPGLDFNRRARRVCAEKRMPLVGNGDVHYLWQLGRTFTWIYAAPEISSIVSAVKQGKVRTESAALSYSDVARWWGTSLWRFLFPVHPAPTDGKAIGGLEEATH